jgi:undecaprenyl-diphosphatase
VIQLLIIFTAQYLYLVVLLIAGVVFLLLDNVDKKKSLILAVVAGVVAFLLVKVSAHFISSPRPFVVDGIKPLLIHAPDNGFPSDHTLVSAVAAFIVFMFNKKVGLLLAFFALTVGISRVLAGIHHPIDILGSFVIAGVSVLIGYIAAKQLKI